MQVQSLVKNQKFHSLKKKKRERGRLGPGPSKSLIPCVERRKELWKSKKKSQGPQRPIFCGEGGEKSTMRKKNRTRHARKSRAPLGNHGKSRIWGATVAGNHRGRNVWKNNPILEKKRPGLLHGRSGLSFFA